jgi:hypothetical protein
MKYNYPIFISLLMVATMVQGVRGQSPDSTSQIVSFSGSIGITNNGFSIIPTFSLNSPATIMNFSWRKNKFSFDPDFRLVPDASKGGLLFWFRYRLIEQKKFQLRIGIHPAFTLVKRQVVENGTSSEITEMLRFAAGELVSTYQIKPKWGVSAMFLHGSGLQLHGPQNTDVLFLSTNFSDIHLGKDIRFQFIPMIFFLRTDGFTGNYLSATGILSHKKSPFSIQSTLNQTITSNIPGNENFMWNVMFAYNFKKIHQIMR